MIVGITGTRPPICARDDALVWNVLKHELHADDTLVVGGCIGIDCLSAQIARLGHMRIVTVLPENRVAVCSCWMSHTDELIDQHEDFLQRDQRIVELSLRMIAFPRYEEHRQPRSGTWATIRRARTAGKIVDSDIHILHPRP